MPEVSPGRSFSQEVLGLVLFALAIFIAAALLSYSPNDPSLNHYQVQGSTNWMGPIGAHLAAFLRDFLGYPAWWIPLFVLLSAWSLVFPSSTFLPPSAWLFGGGAAMLLATSIGFGLGARGGTPSGDIVLGYPGGLVGLTLQRFLTGWIGVWGTILFVLVLFLLGLTAATPFSLIALAEKLMDRRGRAEDASLSALSEGATPPPVAPELTSSTDLAPIEPKITAHRLEAPPPPPKGADTAPEAFQVTPVTGEFALPPLGFLQEPPENPEVTDKDTYLANAKALEQKLHDFGVAGNVVEICAGPVVTMYEFSPAPGVKINKIASLADDLSMALKTHGIRIVAPIPGKSVIGIELANRDRQTVYLKEILGSEAFQKARGALPLALGKDIVGHPVVTDLARMPHLLIAGATGTGKSVGLNAMICSLLYSHRPDTLRLLMIDPKRIELSLYDGIPHLLHPVVSEPKEATRALRWAVMEMERRYRLLEEAHARNLEGYNKTAESPLPYLVVIIDELADLMMVSSKEVETAIARLAQMARAAGIHLLVATQRPSVDVLTGLIKANFPARISFKVSSKVDSRTILDVMGGERLLGMGDMLFVPPGTASLQRIHGAYVSESEIGEIVKFLRTQGEPQYDSTVTEPIAGEGDGSGGDGADEDSDEKYDEAIEIVTQAGQASISMLQRRLRVGYNRAARMIERMEQDGVVTPSDAMGRRQVIARRYD